MREPDLTNKDIQNIYTDIISRINDVNWNSIKHFNRNEWGTGVEHVKPQLIYTIDFLRSWIGMPIIITNAYSTSGHTKNSKHYKGLAVDFYFKDSLIDRKNKKSIAIATILHTTLILEFLNRINICHINNGYGLGVYTDWNHSPGFHLDIRKNIVSYWGRKNNQYCNMHDILKDACTILGR